MQWPARNGAPPTRAVAVVPPLHFVALCHVGARRVSPGPPLRPAGCRARLNRRTNAAVAPLWAARRVGDPAPVGRPAAPVASLPAARSAWPGARERPRGSASLAQPRGLQPSRPAETPARTPPASLRLEGCAALPGPEVEGLAPLHASPSYLTGEAQTQPGRHHTGWVNFICSQVGQR